MKYKIVREADEIIMNFDDDSNWNQLSPEQKRRQLYLHQVKTLNDFLERNAITRAEYEKSLGDLTMKMGMEQLLQSLSANKGGGY